MLRELKTHKEIRQIKKPYNKCCECLLLSITLCLMLFFGGCESAQISSDEGHRSEEFVEVVSEGNLGISDSANQESEKSQVFDTDQVSDTGQVSDMSIKSDLDQESGNGTVSGSETETTASQDESGCVSGEEPDDFYEVLARCYASILPYENQAYVTVNGNQPFFTENEIVADSYEFYSELDDLGRCGVAKACIGIDIMPTEPRGEIGSVRPSGWHTVKYNEIIADNYLYNRCHLIGYQLTGENANPLNLITGTRYLNREGMLPFEEQVSDYVKKTQNHVMYRVTPYYEGDNLVASGVFMEALSVEDEGKKLAFCVYCYNVQPGIEINYANGDSLIDETSEFVIRIREQQTMASEKSPATYSYAVNGKNGKIHITGACSATGNDSNAMGKPIYCETYEEAFAISERVAPNQSKRKCGNCYK